MTSKQLSPTLLVVAAIGALAFWLMGQKAMPPAERSAAEPPTPITDSARNLLRFPASAPQLAMIRASVLPASAVPQAEPLSARITYDAAPLFVVTNPNRLWLMVELPERLLSRVKVGEALDVEADAYPDRRFIAHVAELGQSVDPGTHRVIVRARLDNPGGKLRPEMLVRATLLQDGSTGVRTPNSAIVNRGLYSYVFVETAPGEFQRRKVQLLTQGSDYSYVGEGLKGGELVVVTGALLLDAEAVAHAGDKT